MILIADSGSTKTDWALVEDGQVIGRILTQGINPFHESEEKIFQVLMDELLPRIGDLENLPTGGKMDKIYFYGSGCTPEMASALKKPLAQIFPDISQIEVEGDLLAAARAVCGRQPGIACILGTGANSCFYDGKRIALNTPPLGYILGDEGSGAVLGQQFLNGLFKGFLPQWLRDDYLKTYQITYPDVIRKVYREPLANRYLATTANYIAKHIELPQLRDMVLNNFRCFFDKNLMQYRSDYAQNVGRTDLNLPSSLDKNVPIGFVGGISFQFASLLKQVAHEKGYMVVDIQKSPINGLIKYHSKE